MILFAPVSITYGTLSVSTTNQNGSVPVPIEGLDDDCEVGGIFADDDDDDEISESLETLSTMVLIYFRCRVISSDARPLTIEWLVPGMA